MIQSNTKLHDDEIKSFGIHGGYHVTLARLSTSETEFVRFWQGDRVVAGIPSLVDATDPGDLSEQQRAAAREKGFNPSDYVSFGGIAVNRGLADALVAERNRLRVEKWAPRAFVVRTEFVNADRDGILQDQDDRLIPTGDQRYLLEPCVAAKMPETVSLYHATEPITSCDRSVSFSEETGTWLVTYYFDMEPVEEDLFSNFGSAFNRPCVTLVCSLCDTHRQGYYRYEVRWEMRENWAGPKQSNIAPYSPALVRPASSVATNG